MKLSKSILKLLIIAIAFSSCTKSIDINSDITGESLIPYPVSVEATFLGYDLRDETIIYIENPTEDLNLLAEYLSNSLTQSTGLQFSIEENINSKTKGIILSTKSLNSIIHPEAYKLSITPKMVLLQGNTPEAIFRGIQTLLQLNPAVSIPDSIIQKKYFLPTGDIFDFPRYNYRGAMLDVSRHFFGVEDVKHFIDLMSLYKMNKLHLHLADDQGWRIEIKSWPNLTTHGGSTQVGGGNGGFYTQKQFKEIIDYAASRYIDIIPEIDMPGHTNAALASYAELNCNKKATKLYTGTRVGFSSLCVRDELTYKFIDDVIGELATISPCKYIHIGGDESHSTEHNDYIYFIERVLSIVEKHGKMCIGWDEIAHANIKSNTIAQYWANDKNAQLAVKKGSQVIMSPASLAYMDIKYHEDTKLGLNWAGYIEVDKAYSWNPDTIASNIMGEDILGIEAPLWTETVETMDDIEFLTFPRLMGYAEIGWSPAEIINWDTYKMRLTNHAHRLDSMSINYYKSPVVTWIE